MPPRTRQEVEERYRNDLEAAESFREVQPDRYAELVNQAKDRRFDALDALATEREAAATDREMTATRAQMLTRYPLADAKLITGGTPEEIEASAKALHDFAKRNRDEAEEAARATSRAARSGAYQRGIPASAPQSGPANRGAEREQQEAAQEAKDRNDQLRAQSGLPGDSRDRAVVGRSEEEVLRDIRVAGRASGLSMEAMKARNEGQVVLADSRELPQNLTEEDRRG